jgi:hypothetical protein
MFLSGTLILTFDALQTQPTIGQALFDQSPL